MSGIFRQYLEAAKSNEILKKDSDRLNKMVNIMLMKYGWPDYTDENSELFFNKSDLNLYNQYKKEFYKRYLKAFKIKMKDKKFKKAIENQF